MFNLLKGKRVLITGGSRGIGEACVRAFARYGCRVCFVYKNSRQAAEELAKEAGALAVCADVSSFSQAESALAKAVDYLGGLDILVNNAGIAQEKLFTDISELDWKNMIDINLGGVFNFSSAAAKLMIQNHSGKIINIGSMWGKTGASCEVHYSASKAGIEGLTKALAKELGPSGINVNCIEPGVIDTDMNRGYSAADIAELCERTPLCRLGSADDVANAVCFLASDAASFITGQIIGVDGGFAV